MKTYRVLASYTSYCYLDVQADSLDEAKDIAYNADGGDFTPAEKGDWNVESVKELE